MLRRWRLQKPWGTKTLCYRAGRLMGVALQLNSRHEPNSPRKTTMEINRKKNRCVAVRCIPAETAGLLWFPSSSARTNQGHHGHVFDNTGMSCSDEVLTLEIDQHGVTWLETHHSPWFYPTDAFWLLLRDLCTFGLYLLLHSSALTLPGGDTDHPRSMLCPGSSQVQGRLCTCLSPPLSAPCHLPSPPCLDQRVLGKESRWHFLPFSHILMMLQPISQAGKLCMIYFGGQKCKK